MKDGKAEWATVVPTLETATLRFASQSIYRMAGSSCDLLIHCTQKWCKSPFLLPLLFFPTLKYYSSEVYKTDFLRSHIWNIFVPGTILRTVYLIIILLYFIPRKSPQFFYESEVVENPKI